jgi:hypothetical protein
MRSLVTSNDVLEHFARTETAVDRFERWKSDPGRARVVPAVLAHQSSVVVSVSLEEVSDVCRSTKHALGRVQKRQVRDVHYIRDWTTPFAVSHVFHFVTEHDGAIPTWQRFRQACQEHPFDEMLWNPARQAVEASGQHGVSADLARQAMRWRVGNFYYSFLREQFVHAYLRQQGIRILQHPLADALYAVDGWLQNNVISLFIGNDDFRTRLGGRKHPSTDFLTGRQPPLRFLDIELPVKQAFGVVHLPDPRILDAFITAYRLRD